MVEIKNKAGEKKRHKILITLSFIIVFILMLVFLWDFGRNMQYAEYMRSTDTLANLAEQGMLVAENQLKSTVSVLEAVAKFLEEKGDAADGITLAYLREVAKDNNLNRIGIADANGDAVTTEGVSVNVAEREYFKYSMKGEVHISTALVSKISKEKNIVISVPIRREGEIRGVLYAVIAMEDFNVYANTILDKNNGESYVHIVDSEGNYIVESQNRKRLSRGDNFFRTMKELGGPMDELEEHMENKKPLFMKLQKDLQIRYVYFTPMSMNDWYVATVLPKEALDMNADYSKHIVIRLICKMVMLVLALSAICYYLFAKERAEIKRLNKELAINDQIFQTAVSETGNFVFTYDNDTKTLEFMNYLSSMEGIVPKVIEDFPNNIPEVVPKESAANHEIQRLFADIERGKENIEGEISVDFCGKVIHYYVHIINITGMKEEKMRTVGMLEDVTEEKLREMSLRKLVGRDPLTKAYNRAATEEKINDILKQEQSKQNVFLLIDLDNFKAVNDSLGHLTGDKTLVDVVNIIRQHVRGYDVVGRLGGDEFIVFLVNIPEEILHKNISILLKKLNLTYEVDGVCESVSASIGVALAPKDGTDFRTLYAKADKALYSVKNGGKNNYKIYEE